VLAVTRVGVTGHRSLPNGGSWSWVASTLARELARLDKPIIGLSSLAPGADQLFARLVLELGGSLEAIVSFAEYPETLPDGPEREEYDRLIRKAAHVRVLAGGDSRELAYLLAGETIVRESELLVAVWDSRPARGLGGTADVVRYALSLGRPTLLINPVRRSTEHCPRRPQV
jgi:hypothetical protein